MHSILCLERKLKPESTASWMHGLWSNLQQKLAQLRKLIHFDSERSQTQSINAFSQWTPHQQINKKALWGGGVRCWIIINILQYAFPFNKFAILRSHDYAQIPLELTQIMRMGTSILFAPISSCSAWKCSGNSWEEQWWPQAGSTHTCMPQSPQEWSNPCSSSDPEVHI